MVVVGRHRSIGFRADFSQLDPHANRLPVLLGQLVQRGIAPLDGIEQVDLQWLSIRPRAEAVGSLHKPDLIQKRVGSVRIILDVFGVPVRIGE